ncbi:Flightin [Orchesella cincta]|uniref:Flightin n=1 Tax=Orchesella cincta TaxID=48709 RepID=A0A1D2NER9_ORCCI|nr:Flightin [Orchesella cincta]
MAEGKKKQTTLFTHWARPRFRMYEYNYEVGESYYRPLVRYISTSSALTQSSSGSSFQVETKRERSARRSRAASPPGAQSFIERWTNEPFYGYGIGFKSKVSSSSQQSSLESSSSTKISSEYQSLQQQSLSALSSELRQRRARSVEAASRYASDDCLMRSNALSALRSSAAAASNDVLNTTSLTRKTLVLDRENVLHGKTLDERHYLDYPKQHLVCPDNCPLHNSPEWRRRFLIGNRFLDAAALGGFDVLYDPSVYSTSRRLLAKLASSRESETEEIVIERNSEAASSRRRVHATIY